MAQDDYYYEIQLTNKQLVFYFMAGATGLILSFLAGVMVGKGVDAAGGEVQAAKPVREERIVTEEPVKPATPPSAEELTYAQRLESEKADDSLERSKPASKEAAGKQPATKPPVAKEATGKKVAEGAPPRGKAPKPGAVSPAEPAPAATRTSSPAAEPPARTPATTAAKPAAEPPPPAAGGFAIQVGAFKDRGTADSIVSRLKGKGFAAYVVAPKGADGLFNVRVGSYTARAEAERIQARLRDEEKFKPFIVPN